MSSSLDSATEPAAIFPAEAHRPLRADGDRRPLSYGITFSTQLDAFADIWPALDDQGNFSAHILQRRDWLKVWLTAIRAHSRIRPLFVRVDNASGEPLMLLPLAIEKRHGLQLLGFLDGQFSDCNAPVLFPGAAGLNEYAMAQLWRQLCAALPPFDAALFSKMPYSVGSIPNPLRLLPCEPMPQPRSGETCDRRQLTAIAPLLNHHDIEELITYVGGGTGARRKPPRASPGRLMVEELRGWASIRGLEPPRSGETLTPERVAAFTPLLQSSLPATLAGRAFVRAIKARRALTSSSVGLAFRALRARTIGARLIRSIEQLRIRPSRSLNRLGLQ